MTRRWKVERAGSPGHWIPGWIATDQDGLGASFNTWAEAFAFAYRNARRQAQHRMRHSSADHGRRAMMKLSARGTA